MKTIKLFAAILFLVSIHTSCSSQSGDKKQSNTVVDSKTEKIEVLYFHYTRRCATCNAVENVSKEAVTELYGNKVDFAGFNLDDEPGEKKGSELGISGQTLLIVCGDTKIDITNEGFLNARSNPEKLKAIIKEKIDPLLN